ncbi:nuclear transport factor 2 family protein [Acidicapsa acidisoli]|uniref:nuclear transport factor 2 family protein n=1 Tax=Acidicapsa acidisoli TaxID=1615681 RepID=UPI0021DF6624|nr:nuclear transport factor 2 family protein [Acidicapsa acidisoli]
MTSAEQTNLQVIRHYLSALQDGSVGEKMKRFFTESVRQIELPNKLNPNGQESDLASMLRRSEQGKKVLSNQSYEIVSEVAQGTRVAVEARWVGVLAVPFRTIPVGTEIKAHLAMFFEMEDGRIALQRNYDCFEPW